jgi:hypothetical protein
MLYENLNYDGLNVSLFWYGSSKEKITYLGTFVFHYVWASNMGFGLFIS